MLFRSPEPWITSFAAFVINALPTGGGSKLKKTLLKLISEQYSPEHWLEVEHLYEDIINDDTQTQRLMEGYEPPMDSEELGIVWEALMEEAERLDDEEVVSSNLNVRTLNEEVKKLQKKELSVKKQKRLRFYTFLKKFEEKLLTVGISGDAEIWRFLDIMISKVANISIKNRKEKEHGTQKKG